MNLPLHSSIPLYLGCRLSSSLSAENFFELVASACTRSVHQTSWDLISSVVSGPLVVVDFGLLQLARNLAIQAQMRKVFHRLRFSNISVNASFFSTATARISLAILASARDSGEACTSILGSQ